jgi:hypothetical protein
MEIHPLQHGGSMTISTATAYSLLGLLTSGGLWLGGARGDIGATERKNVIE